MCPYLFVYASNSFTFHYVSIKSHSSLYLHHCTLFNLHSTMYLLNHFRKMASRPVYPHLHSTMYLLNRHIVLLATREYYSFTFHYVSIKSYPSFNPPIFRFNLHSTMYLLNLWLLHNQSNRGHDLHSTMYLLNPGC